MFGAWMERRRYRQRTLDALMLMLDGLGLTSAKALLTQYPAIERALADHQGNGDDYRVAAINTAATVLADQIERHYDAEQRAATLAQIADTSTTKADKNPIAQAILNAEDVAHLWVGNGDVDVGMRDLMMSEVIGALQGYSHEERSRRRIDRALHRALHPTAG